MANELLLINPARRRRRRTTTTRRRRPATRRRRNPVTALAANPRRRPARRRTYAARRRTYRRNPAPRAMRGVMGTLMPAATAATGALALDIIWGFVPLPVTLKTGPMRHLAKGAGAIGLGMLAGMVVPRKTADMFTTGALTVIMHGAMRDAVTRFAPQVNLGESSFEYGYPSIAPPMDAYVEDENMGEYIAPEDEVSGMGETVDEEVYL